MLEEIATAQNIEPRQVDNNDKASSKRVDKPHSVQPEKEESEKKDVISLSFDQVNDNADELIELRGEGRYFGVTDPSSGRTVNALQNMGKLCANCHKRGHVRAKCKTVVCHKCGIVGDHYETQCPTTMVCSRCGLKGHIAAECSNKAKKRQYCKHCDTFTHGDDKCPSIWRSYLTISTDEMNKEPSKYMDTLPVIYCYNCGDDKHYGDECFEQRTSRIPNITGSAFSGSNLPRHLRKLYFDTLNRKDSRRGAKNAKSDYNSNNNGNYNNGKQSNHLEDLMTGYKGNSAKQNNRGQNPSRSGYIARPGSNKDSFGSSKQHHRSGHLRNNNNMVSKPKYQPTRSGVIDKSSKSKKSKSIKHLY